MPTCQNCFHKWTWKESITRFFTFKRSITCPACHTKQFITRRSKQKWSLLNFIPFLPLLLLSFNISFIIVLALQILAILTISLITPFVYKISSEDEALW